MDEICLMQDRLDAMKVEVNRELASKESRLILEIKNVELHACFKMPAITLYNGKTDPNDHIVVFEDHIYISSI